jgi:V/A-type H+-transporting ATPase subunit I
MIVTMAKVAVIGPKEELLEFLALVRELGVLQIEAEPPDHLAGGEDDEQLHALHLNRGILTGRVFHEELRDQILELLDLLPTVPSREPYLHPERIVDSINAVITTHLKLTRERRQRLDVLRRETVELNHYREFLTTIAELLPPEPGGSSLDHIGVEIKDEQALTGLEHLGVKITGGRFELQTTRTPAGKMVGVITTEKEFIDQIRAALQNQQVYDYSLPSRLAGLSFVEQVATCTRLLNEYQIETAGLERQLKLFAHRWLGIYRLVLDWLIEQLDLVKATGAVCETEMCFVATGWLPAADLDKLKNRVNEYFAGRVLVEEKEIRDEELERVPTQIKNRGYFQPFELLTRLLPLPGYRSFDLTPFIGIFFPIFFGMMLGDLGYGLLLLLVALALTFLARHPLLRDLGKIFGVAAVYTMIFGLFFGEAFGSLGQEYLGLRPILLDRHTAIVPMFYFALAMGLVHIVLGLVLGAIASFRYGEKKEGIFKLAGIVVVLAMALAAVATYIPALTHLQKPGLFILLGAMPVLFLAGGLLAPLEVLKHFGNIISYARIMAIGLTSVLLAHVANSMVGMIGSVWLGIFAAILLHGFNIVLGIFAPTVHALRLHYVEFFSKIMTGSGRTYQPLSRTKPDNHAQPARTRTETENGNIDQGGKAWKA